LRAFVEYFGDIVYTQSKRDQEYILDTDNSYNSEPATCNLDVAK
jgi:hypothetical protein